MSTFRKKSEMYPMVVQFKNSSESKKDFCISRGLSVATFSYWIVKYNKENRIDSSQFAELTVEESANDLIGEVELSYPNGVMVRVQGIGQSALSRLIKLA